MFDLQRTVRMCPPRVFRCTLAAKYGIPRTAKHKRRRYRKVSKVKQNAEKARLRGLGKKALSLPLARRGGSGLHLVPRAIQLLERTAPLRILRLRLPPFGVYSQV